MNKGVPWNEAGGVHRAPSGARATMGFVTFDDAFPEHFLVIDETADCSQPVHTFQWPCSCSELLCATPYPRSCPIVLRRGKH